MKKPPTHRPWLKPLIIGLAAVALAAALMAYLFLGRWTHLADADASEARGVFAAALIESGGGTPYIEIDGDGAVLVHHEQEGAESEAFQTLTLLAWVPGDDKILRLDYPRWFVRLKTFSSLNLGTMIAMARQDWDHLDLSVNFADLNHRGPALLLDHELSNGARIMLWTSAGRP